MNNLDRITLAAQRVIEARAAEALAELHALAEHYRRSLGQRARYMKETRT